MQYHNHSECEMLVKPMICHVKKSQGRGQIQMSVILHGLTRSRKMTDILKTNSIGISYKDVQDVYDALGNMTFITTKNVQLNLQKEYLVQEY